MTSSNSQVPNRNSQLKWLLRLTLGLVLIGVLIAWKGAGVRDALKGASPLVLLGAVAFYLSTQLLSAAKWRLLLHAALRARQPDDDSPSSDGSAPRPRPAFTPLSLFECYRIYLIGMFWNLWMPTAIGGDAMRAYLAGQRCGDLPLAASSIFIERLTGLAALMTIGGGGLVWQIASDSGSARGTRAWSTLLLALLLLAGLIAMLVIARRLAYQLEARLRDDGTRNDKTGSEETKSATFKEKLARLWIKMHRALDLYLLPTTRGALAGALAMSLVFQSCHVLLNIALARAVGLPLPAGVFTWLVPSLGIASMLPLGIGGLGVREAAALALLKGVLPAHAELSGTVIAWSLLWQATLWLSALPGAIAHALRRESDDFTAD